MKIGMVGGIGPESTADYYRRIIALYRQAVSSEHYPEIVIDSIDMAAMLEHVVARDWNALTAMLADSFNSLYRAGAGLAFIASNTPHIVFEQAERLSPIPLVSIVESARREAESRALKRAGLLGTLFTMQSRYYSDAFDKSGIDIVVPSEPEQQYIHQKLFSEIEHGIFLDDTREGLLGIIRRMIDEDGIGGVVLGCTELPLILTKDEFGIPFLNTTEIHVRRIMEKYREMSEAQAV